MKKLMLSLLILSSSYQAYGMGNYVYARTAERYPANFIPDDEISMSPVNNTIWLENVLVPDKAGVMDQVKRDIQNWQEREEFEKLWDVRRPGQAATPNRDQKKEYLSRQLLRYADKRLAGEVKSAEKGSTLHAVGAVQRTLKPSSTVKFSEKVKLRFKAQLLQRRATLYVINPYIENRLEINRRGEALLSLRRNLENLKVMTSFRVDFRNDTYSASLTRPIAKNLNAELSSYQNMKKKVFAGDADNRVKLHYYFPF